VVAEGVETDEQLAFLAEQECDIVQGHLFSKALPPEQFEARWLAPRALAAPAVAKIRA
jgi:EAL domain-containing protein (putative c-di-GMP-specific phosphodiesterase class I)